MHSSIHCSVGNVTGFLFLLTQRTRSITLSLQQSKMSIQRIVSYTIQTSNNYLGQRLVVLRMTGRATFDGRVDTGQCSL